jgi:colanic acid biosynthesis glycosyl transferase WcaI
MTGKARTFVIVTQVYVPDPAAAGQHLADVAEELVRRGNRVIVYTASRGYADPSVKYPRRETIRGVDVRRIPLASFGKSSIPIRLLGGMSFILQATVRAIFSRSVDAVLVSTSPPIAPLAGVAIGRLRRAPIKYWVMDVNPDQMVALEKLPAGALPVRLFEWLNRLILRNASDVIVLDRFMADRIAKKGDVRGRVSVLPPWSLPAHPLPHAENPFRREHDLDGKFVLMYSGNHGPSNPLTTVIEAAKRMTDESRFVMLVVGGGIAKGEVDDASSPNIISIPYQPPSELMYSLAAADVHVVSVGDRMAGIVHPSKVYAAMAAGRPILLLGPAENHVADILASHDIGWHIAHGDVDAAERLLRALVASDRAELERKGRVARAVMAASGGQDAARSRVCDVIEEGTQGDSRG